MNINWTMLFAGISGILVTILMLMQWHYINLLRNRIERMDRFQLNTAKILREALMLLHDDEVTANKRFSGIEKSLSQLSTQEGSDKTQSERPN